MSTALVKTDKIIVTIVSSIFTSKSESIEIPYTGHTTLQDICDLHYPKGDWLVGINGKIFPILQWSTTEVLPGEQVVFSPNVGGPIAALWVAIQANVVAAFIVNTGIAYGLGRLVQSLTAKPKFNPATFQQHNLVSPQFYGWDPVTLQRPGIPIPKYYGNVLEHGNIIHAWTEPTATGLAQTIHAIISYGRGPVQGTTSSDLGKNIFFQGKQPIQNFTGVTYEERKGTLHQTPITLFSEGIKLEFRPRIVTVNGEPRIHIVRNNNYDGLDVEISFPKGIFFLDGGNVVNNTVNIKIEIAEDGTDSWFTLVQKDITEDVQTNYLVAFNNEGTYAGGSPVTVTRGTAYKVRLTKNTAERESPLYGDQLQFNAVRTVYKDGFNYPSLALVGIIVEATDQLSGSFQCSIQQEGRLCEVYTDATESSITYTTDLAWILYNVLTNPMITGGGSGEIQNYVELALEGLVGHWKLDDNIDTIDFIDSSDSENHGLLIGGFSSARHVSGEIDGAFQFSGTYGIVADNDEYRFISQSDFTMCSWVRFDSDYVDYFFHTLIGRINEGSNDKQWGWTYHMPGKMWMFHTRDVSRTDWVQGATSGVNSWTPTPGVWYHIALIRVGTTFIFYVDGEPIGSDRLIDIPTPSNNNILIGQGGPTRMAFTTHDSYVRGRMDDVRLYNRDLSTLELHAIHDKTVSLPPEDYEEVILPYVTRSYKGLPPSKIDLDSFLELSRYTTKIIKNSEQFGGTEEARFTFNGGFDTHSSRWEAVQKICESANAVPVWDGHTLSIAIEKPRELSQIFNITNIQRQRLSVFFLNQIDRATEVVTEYKNNNDRATVTAIDTTKDFNGTTTIERMFCNSESMAWRYAAEQILRNRFVKKGLNMDVNIQAITCRIGDRVRIAHPVFTKDKQCGGTIMQVIGDGSIQIDTPEDDIPDLSSTSRIAIRTVNLRGEERIEMYDVATSNGNVVVIDGVWSTIPKEGDTFILGDTTSFTADYEIMDIKQFSDLNATLICQQYYEFLEQNMDELL